MNRRGFMAAAAGFLMAPFAKKQSKVHWPGGIEVDLGPSLEQNGPVLFLMDDDGGWHSIPPIHDTFPISFKEEA
jgi:hypothetical protein